MDQALTSGFCTGTLAVNVLKQDHLLYKNQLKNGHPVFVFLVLSPLNTTILKIETERLQLFPLSHQQVLAYMQTDFQLESELKVKNAPRAISLNLIAAIQKTILPAVADKSKNYLYCTIWAIVSKAHTQMVADFCFKGEPNHAGEIEVGYGTYEAFRGQGFMTEAIGAIAGWAFEQPEVRAILAETNTDNIASQKILEKNRFKQVSSNPETIWWRLEKPATQT
jgi:GNAT superfamily N-acetyltransferase